MQFACWPSGVCLHALNMASQVLIFWCCFVHFKHASCLLDRSVYLNLVLAGWTHFTVRKEEKRLIWHVWRVWEQRGVEQQLQHRGQRGWRAQSSCRSAHHQEQWPGVHLPRWKSWHGLVQVSLCSVSACPGCVHTLCILCLPIVLSAHFLLLCAFKATCEMCGMVGVRDAFYSKTKRFCSVSCSRSYSSNSKKASILARLQVYHT